MGAYLSGLFASDGFLPHGLCLSWDPALIWVHVLSDGLIAVAYYTIPAALLVFVLRRQDVPFKGWAALTVGLLEMMLGRDDAARAHLTEANELGGQFGNHWLESSARTQLASLAVRAGQLEEARALLVDSVNASEEGNVVRSVENVRSSAYRVK